MKKSLIALAALAVVSAASAQSSVTLSGLIDTGIRSTDAKGVKSQGLNGSGNSATTVLTFAGSEDLGGGLNANFQLQITPDFVNGAGVAGTTANSTSTTTAAGTGTPAAATYTTATKTTPINNAQQAFVGLSGNFGQIQAGRVNSNVLDAWGVGSVFGTALGSGYGSNGNMYSRYSATALATSMSAPTRFNGAVRYLSPVISGFSGSVLVVPKSTSADAQSVTDFGLRYSAGPLNVMFANQEIKQTGTQAAFTGFIPTGAAGAAVLANGEKNKITTISANYTFDAVTVLGALWTEKQGTAVSAAGQMIGAKYAMGAVTLLASVGRNNDKLAANADQKIYGIGADYALSKRSTLFARYENRNQNTTSAANDVTKVTSVGVKHTF
jgi:predicted porin